MIYRRCGRSGLQLPAISLGLWHNFGHDRPLARAAGHLPASVRPGGHPFRPRQQLRPAVRRRGGELRPDHGHRSRAVPRRAGHLDEGRVRHVARPIRRVGLAQVPHRLAGPVAAADGTGLRGHLLLAPAGPAHAARGDDGRPGCGGTGREGALRRHLVLLVGLDAGGGGDPARARHSVADPPAVVLDDQSLAGGGRPAGHTRGGRRRLHRVLAAGPGTAHRSLPRRDSRRLPHRHRRRHVGVACSPRRTWPRCGR